MKSKFYNILIISLLLGGILFIFINTLIQISIEQKILYDMKSSINIIKNISSTVFHLQKERGLVNIYLNGEESIYNNILQENILVDENLKKLKNFNLTNTMYSMDVKLLENKINSIRQNYKKNKLTPIDTFLEYTQIINNLIDLYIYPIKEPTTSAIGKYLTSIYFLEKIKEYAGEFRGIFSSIIKKENISDTEYFLLDRSFYMLTEFPTFNGFPLSKETYNKIKKVESEYIYKDIMNYYELFENKSKDLLTLNPETVFNNLTNLVDFFQTMIDEELSTLEVKVNTNIKYKKNSIFIDFLLLIFSIILFVFILKNYYKLINTKNKLKYLASHDRLTNLSNRNLFFEKAENILALADRNNLKYAIMFIDIDNFKKVNDYFGHDNGDTILKNFANILKRYLRTSDVISRFGGDEFLILMQYKKIEDIFVVAKKLNEKMYKKFTNKNSSFFTSLSIGISLFPEHSKNLDELIKYADIAMYEAKKTKNNIKIYKPGD
ncbi:diguanylate cyclase (GGDEF) domain-containing protein [Marinitoga hydrogenitolerans DSM 16785]|uniref:Diguanylate cyclase (GGDEF) domain-containing protein n=1 Tax=Marinitoga hydrogenitolerans (strain DSM 16785 / JCM 12826 / AT1271) TaxID=1122195 RepID=A0A1M4ZRN5_MARH1|nr:diguanylate cyclase [Marinitoga hydrogenitolerans]SHF20575.1 diguanylate cyclase (GGDEF) domain-containing protein [Marinitoga hydrogenitolerans DSM 16785]